jgi:hypothetical protein
VPASDGDLTRHQQQLIDAAAEIRERWPLSSELSFMAKHLVQVTTAAASKKAAKKPRAWRARACAKRRPPRKRARSQLVIGSKARQCAPPHLIPLKEPKEIYMKQRKTETKESAKQPRAKTLRRLALRRKRRQRYPISTP